MFSICGTGVFKEVDEKILAILKSVSAELKTRISEKRNGAVPEKMEPKGYKMQIVALGTNYFVNLEVGDKEHIHARIYRNMSGILRVHSVTDIKDVDAEIGFF